MTIYDASSGRSFSLDAREAAPMASTPDMFHGDPEASTHGPLSVGVPGEIAGYWAAKQRFGNRSIRCGVRLPGDGSNVLCRHFHDEKLETVGGADSADVQRGHHGVLDPG